MHKIIIVEDEEIIRNGLAISFDWMDYGCNIVGLAKDGKEGLDMILELNPDIVISDIKMPKMTGIEMIQNAKKQGKDFFSIILTSYAEFGYAKSAIEFGASGYLLKPVDEDELVELLKSITDKINKKNRQKKIEESVKDKIIKKAISYLEKTDLMIYEISCKVGFSDYKYFCTVFKKYTSLSPSEYQKTKQKDNDLSLAIKIEL